jgi:hypothetical protein
MQLQNAINVAVVTWKAALSFQFHVVMHLSLRTQYHYMNNHGLKQLYK